jgi:hypothetical protein
LKQRVSGIRDERKPPLLVGKAAAIKRTMVVVMIHNPKVTNPVSTVGTIDDEYSI